VIIGIAIGIGIEGVVGDRGYLLNTVS